MALASDIDAPLTLEMSGEDVTPDIFVRGVRSFFAVLSEMTGLIDDKVKWRIQVKQGSNLVGVFPRGLAQPSSVRRIIGNVEAALSALEREDREPDDFGEKALDATRDLAKLAVASDGDIVIRVWADKTPCDLTARSIATIDSIFKGAFEEHGAVEGRIQTVSERGGAKFVVYEGLSDRAVTCHVPPEMLDEAVGAFGRRAAVYGQVKYAKDGRPSRISVESIDVFPRDDDIPTASDVRGILRNMPR